MGSGKSTVSKKLANLTGISVIDLDKKIEKREKLTINEIFKQKGEVYFRKLERTIFIKLLESPKTMIIALGGGTPCYANNHELLNGDNVCSIYLKASVDTLVNRLFSNRSKRPILADKSHDELKEFVAKHLFERSFYYNQAQYKVSIDGRTKDETADDILKILA
jgi:shikimate kinase